MANFQALGTGPVSFVDTNQNQQEIPLSAISFGPNGVDGSAWPGYSANQNLVDALLKQMVSEGFLIRGTQSAPVESMEITAAATGSNGNGISVTFSNPSPTAGTVDVAVQATEVYPGLTSTSIAAALGTSAATANGLVFLQANNNQMPINFTGSIVGPSFTLVVPDAASDAAGAFTLAATDQSYTIHVAVALDEPPPVSGPTFTLTVTGSKSAAGQTLTALETSATNPFKTLVTFSGPASGPLPAAGTVTLAGGAPASSTSATAAQAEVFSS